MPGVLRCEITLGPPRADAGLVGSGLIVIDPPFKLDADLKVLLPALAGAFAAEPPAGSTGCAAPSNGPK